MLDYAVTLSCIMIMYIIHIDSFLGQHMSFHHHRHPGLIAFLGSEAQGTQTVGIRGVAVLAATQDLLRISGTAWQERDKLDK